MPFRDILKKKEKIETSSVTAPHPRESTLPSANSNATTAPHPREPDLPTGTGTPKAVTSHSRELSEPLPHATPFTFVRSDTNTQEFIQPPKYDGDDDPPPLPEPTSSPVTTPKKVGRFRKGSVTTSEHAGSPPRKDHKRLSQILHLGGSNRARSTSSPNVPENLPDVPNAYNVQGDEREKEAKWEERATVLASQRPGSATGSQTQSVSNVRSKSPSGTSGHSRGISDADSDVNIQEAIRLHEAGKLEAATRMFYTLAEQGNVLSQVLYGLSLRHGWGCEKDPAKAVDYLSAAAANSAAIESEALKAGMKTGGAAKGELVLAIFELANCYRYGWGVAIDKFAARQYYETAANLGDTDAMDQAAWCYVEGFGGKKDKYKAAQLLRLAEKNGHKTLGNTWIWKEKYDPK